MSISKQDYDFFGQILKASSGLALGNNKEYLLESRLNPLCKELNLKCLAELADKIRINPNDKVLIKRINDLMTTNESLFFRDYTPFEVLQKKILPSILAKRAATKKLTIWSAACSTGQEPYSIAMMLKEFPLSFSDWKITIVATDFSDAVLKKASEGVYSTYELSRGMPANLLTKYFEPMENNQFVVKKEIKSVIEWKFLNLMEPYTLPTFDIVFLRNVLIYFENSLKSEVLNKVAKVTAEDGYLLLGGAETVFGLSDSWAAIDGIRSAIYKKRS